MKSLTIKLGTILTVVLLSMAFVGCSPYSSVGVSGGYGYGAPYGGYRYGYGSPYGYGYRPPVIVTRPPVIVQSRPYYSTPRSYGPRSYGGGGYRGGGYGRRR